MQRVTPNIRDTFGPVDKALRDSFMPALFQGVGEGIPHQGVNCLPVKQAGLNLPDQTLTDLENWTASCVVTGHLGIELRSQEDFRTAYHASFLR